MTDSAALSPNDEQFALRQTNVSSPSVVHRPSKQSITASEDYYSLSSGDSALLPADARGQSTNTIHRYQTPPSRYRTPGESSTSTQNFASQAQAQYALDESADPDVRKTPMRGEGKRRQSYPESSSSDSGAAGPSTAGAVAALREGGIRRKPVPSTVMEAESPKSQEYIDPSGARSSVARDIERGDSPPTPGHDDTPYIRFALDQLTRDEEVRGSRQYPGAAPAAAAPTITVVRDPGIAAQDQAPQVQPSQSRDQQGGAPIQPLQARDPQGGAPDGSAGFGPGAAAAGAAALGAGALAAGAAHASDRDGEQQLQPSQQWPDPSRPFDQPPPRDPRHVINRNQEPDLFIPVSNEGRHHMPLDFLPGILRPVSLIIFVLVVLIVLVLLLASAIWSLVHNGIFNYGSFGDGKYFTFEYLPTMLGMVILYWLYQIEVAAYRIAPFIAMASSSARSWEEGATLPMYPKTFLLPYFGHFSARQGVMGFFVVVCWMQVWTIPLLASSFNVFFFGSPTTGIWRWTATAGLVWVVIGLYILLIVAVVMLMLWLRRQYNTGLRWDPRSLADMIVLLERSNALTMNEDDEIRHDAPRLGYWRTSRGGTEVFHSYGVADKPARRYSVDGGRIVEKPQPPQPEEQPEPKSRFSSQDLDISREQRNSREKMLPKHLSGEDQAASGGRAVPWCLRPSAALLWVIMAWVLLLAFLIVSYLPSTAVSHGFDPLVPAPVNSWGYSATNFLYSFIPATLATICFLGLLDIDYAYRRLATYSSLLANEGELAEKSLLLSYPADLPGVVTASALANADYRVAILSLASFVAITLPILGGGVFWAQFDIRTQSIIISAQMSAYYALTVFVALYAASIFAAFPWDKKTRDIDPALPRSNQVARWCDIVSLFRASRLLDDVAFRNPASKTALVTRLLSAPPGTYQPLARPPALGSQEAAAASKVSLADSVRGLGRARLAAGAAGAGTEGLGSGEVPRYGLGLFTGRDGREFVGVDRLRS